MFFNTGDGLHLRGAESGDARIAAGSGPSSVADPAGRDNLNDPKTSRDNRGRSKDSERRPIVVTWSAAVLNSIHAGGIRYLNPVGTPSLASLRSLPSYSAHYGQGDPQKNSKGRGTAFKKQTRDLVWSGYRVVDTPDSGTVCWIDVPPGPTRQ